MSICSLCTEEKPLRNSHVLSEFLYQPIYDDKHRILTYSSYERGKERPAQKGMREPILCQDCETKRSRWERYAADVLFGLGDAKVEVKEGYAWVTNIDYAPFKLFLMSNLWMAGVALQEFFAQVQLGDRHHERLRQMMEAEDPGEPWDYPCVVEALMKDGKLLTEWLVQPTSSRLAGQRCYQFVYGGFSWLQVVASHRLPNEFGAICLKSNGGMGIRLTAPEEHPGLVDLAGRLQQRYDRDGNLLRA